MSNITQHVANGATGVGVMSTGTMFITENAPLIGVMLTAFSVIVALIFYVLNYRINRARLLLAIRDEEGGGALSKSDINELRKILSRRRTDHG